MTQAGCLIAILIVAVSATASGQGAQAGAGDCAATPSGCGAGAGGSSLGGQPAPPPNNFSMATAKQLLIQAAACRNLGQAACLRNEANWYKCTAYTNGFNANCGAKPTCSASCAAAGGPSIIPAATVGKTSGFQLGVGIFTSIMSSLANDDDDSGSQPDNTDNTPPPPDPAELAAAKLAQDNADASALLASVNSYMSSAQGADPGSATQPSPNATLNSLLDDSAPSNTVSSAINNLLDDSTQPADSSTPVAAAVNSLLAGNDTPPPANAPQPGDAFYQPPPVTSVPYNGPFPDNQITIDWGETEDQPDPTMFDTLRQNLQSMAQGVEQKVSDSLAPVIDPVIAQARQTIAYTQQQISTIVSDPGVQSVYQVISGGGTTMPLTQPGDTPETMVNNVYGTATAGGVNLVKGPSGLGTYMNGNVNQINAGLGWANTQIAGTNGSAVQ